MGVRARVTRHEELRRALGFGVQQFAREVGFSHGYVSQIEGGDRASARYRKAAAKALRTPVEVLFDENGEPR